MFQIFWKDLEVAKAKVASDGKFEVHRGGRDFVNLGGLALLMFSFN